MTPLRLLLRGFAGIRSGMGRAAYELDLTALPAEAQLVALVGRNGAGKSTVIDNLHPYRIMPSRAPGLSVARFSYYEHLCAPEALKELDWENEGVHYRSVLLMRTNGRRSTDAYLYRVVGAALEPVRLADGTVSNGSAVVYDTLIEHLLGSAETFFTSAFSAQGRRLLATFSNAEAKGLMADLLGLDDIREKGAQATRVLQALRIALDERRTQLEGLRHAQAALAQLQSEQPLREATEARTRAQLQTATARVEACQASVGAAREAAREEAASSARHAQLTAEISAAMSALARERAAGEQVSRQHAVRRTQLQQQHAREQRANREREAELQRERAKAALLVGDEPRVLAAAANLADLEAAERAADDALQVAEQHLRHHAARQADLSVVLERIRGLERDAGQAVLRLRELRERHGLTAEVPCHGTALQGACQLLEDARAARPLIPDAEHQIARLSAERTANLAQAQTLRQALAESDDAAALVNSRRTTLDAARRARAAASSVAAQAAAVGAARARLTHIEQELVTHAEVRQRAVERYEQALAQLDAQGQADGAHAERRVRDAAERVARLQEQLKSLRPTDTQRLPRAERELALAAAERERWQGAHLQAAADSTAARTRLAVLAADSGRAAAVDLQIRHIEEEVGWWSLLAKALGNDGVIALCIDDAGPTLAQITNDLLKACYGARFTVAIRTEVLTARGDAREGFDIVVFDATSGESTSVGLLSGGERVWINECLTRAIALYLAATTQRRYETLFCDETDGALDPERKRMFMQMKREVLRIGGYRREYFVSQTPELAAMADAQIAVA